jgi:hypothetical protein
MGRPYLEQRRRPLNGQQQQPASTMNQLNVKKTHVFVKCTMHYTCTGIKILNI